MSILHKIIYKLNMKLIKIPVTFHRPRINKFCMENQYTLSRVKTILIKKNKTGDIIHLILIFTTKWWSSKYYGLFTKNRHIDHWKTKSPEINLTHIWWINLRYGANNILWRALQLIVEEPHARLHVIALKSTCKRMKLEHHLTLYIKINSKTWI